MTRREVINKLCGYNPEADTTEDGDINSALSDLEKLEKEKYGKEYKAD